MTSDLDKDCKWGGGNDYLACRTCGVEYDYRRQTRPPCPRRALASHQPAPGDTQAGLSVAGDGEDEALWVERSRANAAEYAAGEDAFFAGITKAQAAPAPDGLEVVGWRWKWRGWGPWQVAENKSWHDAEPLVLKSAADALIAAQAAEIEGLRRELDILRGAVTWVAPPFVTAETSRDEIDKRIGFLLADAARAALKENAGG